MSVALPWVRSVFGVGWSDLTASHLLAAASAGVRRAELVWLDGSHVDSASWEPTAWLTNVLAGLANGNGGLVVVGFESAVIEPSEPDVLSAQPVPLNAAYGEHVHRICRGAIVPQVHNVGTRQVPVDAERGFFLVAVERSPLAPHACLRAVVGTSVDGLSYPVVGADGSSMRYLFESEVAARYRSRAVLADDLLRRATRVWEGGRGRRAPAQETWLDISLSPARPARLDLDGPQARRIREYARAWNDRSPLAGLVTLDLTGSAIARGRVLLPGERCHAELYADGSGFATMRTDTGGDHLELGTLVLLHLLAGHAEASGVGGDAVVAAGLGGDRLVFAPALHTIAVVELATDGRELVAAARWIAADVLADVGLSEPEVLLIDGGVSLAAVRPELRDALLKWAEVHTLSRT